MLRENPNWHLQEAESGRHCPFLPHPKCHPFLVQAGQAIVMKKWADTWKFLTGVMGAGTERPGVMELDVTVTEPSRPAPGHAEFDVRQFQSLSCPDSRMVTTNGQSQWKCSENLKNPFLTKWWCHNNIGAATRMRVLQLGEGEGAAGRFSLVWCGFVTLLLFSALPSKSRVSVSSSGSHFCIWFLCCQRFPTLVPSDDSNSFNIMISAADPCSI